MSGRYVLATISLDNMAGGLERNIVRLANALSRRGHTISLITFDQRPARSFYRIDDGVRWYKVGVSPPHGPIGLGERLRLIRAIRAALIDAQATAIICFHHGILVRFVLASLLAGIRIIVSERNSLSLYEHITSRKWNPNFLLLFLVHHVIVQFPRYVADYPRALHSRISAIPNPVSPVETCAGSRPERTRKPLQLLAVGRLCAQKNYEALIEAFAELAPRHPAWELLIVGDGAIRESVVADIARRGLEERVRLASPVTDDMSEVYRRASLFCMPSRWEGFPNALAEAMAHGLPCVGYGGCAGVRDLIAHGENGLLAKGNGDTRSLRDALDRLMADPAERKRMGGAAAKSVRLFRPELILSRWEALLSAVETSRRGMLATLFGFPGNGR
ncbi:MAG: glycosyltransferase family 4 protein [Chloroflexi bacterium]|nr:glycosyltransferase family 4 protein [Chloroflexota bacterium]